MSERMRLAETVLERIGARAEAEVRVAGGSSALTRFANSFIHQNVGEEGDVVSLRMAADGRVASGTTSNVDPDRLGVFVEETLERCRVQPVDPHWPGLTGEDPGGPAVDHYDPATAAAEPADRAGRVAAFGAAGPDMEAAGYCSTSGVEIAFANSAGVSHEGRYTAATLDGIHRTGTSAGSGHAASNRLDDIDAAAVGALAAERATGSVGAYDVKPGDYQVVLSPECVATIGIFLAYYGFNGKFHNEGMSFAEVGADQFDPAINLVDDATDARAVGIGFDTEGTRRSPVTLVETGATKGLFHDRRTAAQAGAASTGHAAPGSEVYGPVPSALFFAPGDRSAEDLIEEVDRGIYVATFNYCRVLDPKTMAVTGLTRNGTFMIENGRITGAVTGMRFTQSFLAALGPGNVLGIGNDARWADSEFGPLIVNAPSMWLGSWHFTGGTEA
ncbi:MAG: TldD/PmbA family protein [Acidimicrobiia bacterium]|nr:TldD/PmbA family protein [Acidimicrobiia bacterium]